MRAAVLTVSDGVFWEERDDVSGPVLAGAASAAGFEVAYQAVVPDERSQIAERVLGWCDGQADLALVLVTGGTGFAPRDVTPEALAPLYHRRAPGLDEAMRAASLREKPHGMLTRGVSGVRGRTLILSFPGNPNACREGFEVVRPVLDHALRLLRDAPTAHL